MKIRIAMAVLLLSLSGSFYMSAQDDPRDAKYKLITQFSPPCELMITCTSVVTNHQKIGCTSPGSVVVLDVCALF